MQKEVDVAFSSLSERYVAGDLEIETTESVELEVTEGEVIAVCRLSNA